MGRSQVLGQRDVVLRPCHNYHLERAIKILFSNKSSVAQNVRNLFIHVPYNSQTQSRTDYLELFCMYTAVFPAHDALTLLRSKVVQLIDSPCQLPQLTLGEMLHQKRKEYLP